MYNLELLKINIIIVNITIKYLLIMKNEIINDWLKSFGTFVNKEELDGITHYEFDFEGSPVNVWAGNGYLKLEYSYDNLEDEFIKYCESLDDDVFIETCEDFNKVKSLHEFSKNINAEDVATFKEIADKIICDKINHLRKMISK